METILYTVLLIVGIVVMTIVFTKMVPAFGRMIENGFETIKKTICEKIGFAGFLFGC
ncbi:MAG: hypothetical protein QW472_01015 [Candidatus Aenigmatarchaeota archaeon]